MTDAHLDELMRQCATATPLGRLSNVEQLTVVSWLIDNGHMVRTGKELSRPRLHPRPIARTRDGAPIYEPGTNFATHETVTMPAAVVCVPSHIEQILI